MFTSYRTLWRIGPKNHTTICLINWKRWYILCFFSEFFTPKKNPFFTVQMSLVSLQTKIFILSDRTFLYKTFLRKHNKNKYSFPTNLGVIYPWRVVCDYLPVVGCMPNVEPPKESHKTVSTLTCLPKSGFRVQYLTSWSVRSWPGFPYVSELTTLCYWPRILSVSTKGLSVESTDLKGNER